MGGANGYSLSDTGFSLPGSDAAYGSATRIADPSTGLFSPGGSSGSGAPNDAATYWGDVISQLQSELGSAKSQQPTLISNIENAANKARSDLNSQESTAESGYATQRGTNAQSRASTISSINQGARTAFDSLMGILQAAGAGVSSVARFGGPQAVAGEASSQRGGANTTFNANDSAITTAENATKQQYQSALSDLLTNENTSKGNALASLLGQEAQLEQQIGSAQINRAQAGGLSYADARAASGDTTKAIGSIEDQLSHIFTQYATPSFKVNPITVSTPNMAAFSSSPIDVKAANANPNTDSSLLPYLASLKQDNTPGGILTGPKQQPQLQPAIGVS